MTLRELLRLNRIPQQLVADALGVSQSNIARFDDLKKRSLEEVLTISKATGLSIGILLGDDFVNELSKDTVRNGRPYYEEIVMMLDDLGNNILETTQDHSLYSINYPPFYDCMAYLLHKGDAMSPMLNAGDALALYNIDDMNFLQWGEPYLIVVDDNDIMRAFVYVIYPGKNNNIIARASNPKYEGDIIINKKNIMYMYLVKGRITRFQMR